jgi:ribonuclease P protein component
MSVALNNHSNLFAIRNTFKAYERLKREQHIDTLFRTGKAFSVFPLKLIYLLAPRASDELSPVRAGFSIPKRKFKSSVDRNRLKRLLREGWRLHKAELYERIPANQQLHVFVIFTGEDQVDFSVIENAIVKGIDKLIKQLTKIV